MSKQSDSITDGINLINQEILNDIRALSGYDETDLSGKCATCVNFIPLIQNNIERARGTCPKSKCRYKQRTETCSKYVEKEWVRV